MGPQLDEASLLLLLQLLRVNSPLTKTLLQRLLHNLVMYAPLNAAIVRILLASLRGPLTFDEHGEGGADAPPLLGVEGEVRDITYDTTYNHNTTPSIDHIIH